MIRAFFIAQLTVSLLCAAPEDEIRKVLTDQVIAWNRGNIPEFMKAYDRSEQTAFAGSSGVTHGYERILARYKQRYPTRENMGVLAFSDLQVRMLGEETALVTGRFRLKRTKEGGGDATGWFTLVFLKRDSGWKVIHDHTS
jgi:uncharacterized protein (TIGR02246 family)